MPDASKQTRADVFLTTALLGSFRSVEVFVACASLLGAASFAIFPEAATRSLSAAVFGVGIATLYHALRIRIDYRIFADWDKISPAELDASLQKVNPRFRPGRTLESRLSGAHSLFTRGMQLAGLQCVLLIGLAWAVGR
ncbi:MAG: hypothetical protein QM756_04960 [Polyangiaceae bacterium]